MRAPSGYLVIVEPDRPVVERETISCFHCGRIVQVKPGTASTVYLLTEGATGRTKEEPGAFCRICMRPVCLPCHAIGTCTPWEQQMERSEARDRLRRSLRLD